MEKIFIKNNVKELKYAKDKQTIAIVFNGHDSIGLGFFRFCRCQC